MCWKLFDAAYRVLMCGMAVVLLTALAIPALIDLGIERKLAEETAAPLLSSLIVLLFYFILSAWPRRVRKGTYTEAEKKKAMWGIFWQPLLVPVLAALIIMPVLHLANAPLGCAQPSSPHSCSWLQLPQLNCNCSSGGGPVAVNLERERGMANAITPV
jgi:cytochrome bd-type quinol oxidase subunit 2